MKTHKLSTSTKESFRIILIVSIIMISGLQVLPQKLKITSLSGTTFDLPDPNDLKGPAQAGSAGRTTEIAIKELTEDSQNLEKKRNRKLLGLEEIERRWTRYHSDVQKQITKKNTNETEQEKNDDFDAEIDEERTRYNKAVDEFNRRPAEQQDKATAAWLDRWRERGMAMEVQWAEKESELEKERTEIDSIEGKLLSTYYSTVAEEEVLNYELNEINIQLGEAYNQLLQLKGYADKINVILRKYEYSPLHIYIIETELEKIKNLSGVIFDGNKPQTE